jgi:hypothetical protein
MIEIHAILAEIDLDPIYLSAEFLLRRIVVGYGCAEVIADVGKLEIETTRAETRWCPHCVYNRRWREAQPAPGLGSTAEDFQCARTLDDCGSVRRSWAH